MGHASEGNSVTRNLLTVPMVNGLNPHLLSCRMIRPAALCTSRLRNHEASSHRKERPGHCLTNRGCQRPKFYLKNHGPWGLVRCPLRETARALLKKLSFSIWSTLKCEIECSKHMFRQRYTSQSRFELKCCRYKLSLPRFFYDCVIHTDSCFLH